MIKKAPKKTTTIPTVMKLSGNQRGSDYIHELRRDYSLYVMKSRAIVAESDGLKSAARRLLWIARDGGTYKSFNLAAATAPLHPHSSPEGSINTLAAQYINNIPLLQGIQSFGTFVEPKAFAASRYTDVKLSKFTKEVMFADSEIIPMMDNYDKTHKEPVHFLPLVPVSLINFSEGVAVGFTSAILPRKLSDIIDRQIACLEGKKVKPVMPCSEPIDSCAVGQDTEGRWLFEGNITHVSHNTVRIDKLPFGVNYESVMNQLRALKEKDTIVDFQDDSKTSIDILVTFKKGALRGYETADLLKMFKMTSRTAEKMAMLAFSGNTIVEHTFETAIASFCQWRLAWFVDRYEFQKKRLSDDLQYVKDYIRTVDSGTAAKFTTEKSKEALEQTLRALGVVYDERIARLPAYSFTKAEYDKMVAKKKQLELELAECNAFLKSEPKRRDQYILELKELQKNHKQGKYSTQF